MKAKRIALALALASTASALVGCGSSEPSASDIQEMLDNTNKSLMQGADPKAAALVKGLMPSVTINEVKGCEEIRDDIFRCDVDMTTKAFGAEVNNVQAMTLTLNSKGDWVQTN